MRNNERLLGICGCMSMMVMAGCGGNDPLSHAFYGAYLNDDRHEMSAAVIVRDDASYAEVRLYEEVVQNDDGEHPLYADVRYEGELQVATETIRELESEHVPVFTASDGNGGEMLRAAFSTDDHSVNVRGALEDGRDALRLTLTVDNVPLGQLVLLRSSQSHFADDSSAEE